MNISNVISATQFVLKIRTYSGNLNGMLDVHKNEALRAAKFFMDFFKEALKTVREFMTQYLLVCLDLCLSNGTKTLLILS